MDNVPLGADYDTNAPWRAENRPKMKDVEVTVSVCMSKTFKVKVQEGYENDNNFLKGLVLAEYVMPYEVPHYLRKEEPEESLMKVKSDLQDWNVDDFAVVVE